MSRVFISFLVVLLIPVLASGEVQKPQKTPEKLLFLVFDQFRPDYIDRFHLKHFAELRAQSLEYTNAIVGDLPSITVVSHAVMGLGLLPKDLPWKDNLYRDQAGVLGEKGLSYDSHKLDVEQFQKLSSLLPQETSLGARLHLSGPGRIFVIGEKMYAAMSFALPVVDSVVTLKKEKGVCRPTGVNVPDWIVQNSRYTLDCQSAYDSEDAFYAYDGARLVPGRDPEHLGGDVWVADIALEIFQRETWRAVFLTFGGVDKAGHLWGTMDVETPHPFHSEFTLEVALKTADEQLGRILKDLSRRGLREKTLIVLTADHGAQTNRFYLGNQSGDLMGEFANFKAEKAPPFWIERAMKYAQIEVGVFDTAIRFWLKRGSGEREAVLPEKFLEALGEISGVQEIHHLRYPDERPRYEKVLSLTPSSGIPQNDWISSHSKMLLESLASPAAPDVVVLLGDGFGFDLLGDHGGAQEKVQRIPLFFSLPGATHRQIASEQRLVDIKTLVLKAFGLPQ